MHHARRATTSGNRDSLHCVTHVERLFREGQTASNVTCLSKYLAALHEAQERKLSALLGLQRCWFGTAPDHDIGELTTRAVNTVVSLSDPTLIALQSQAERVRSAYTGVAARSIPFDVYLLLDELFHTEESCMRLNDEILLLRDQIMQRRRAASARPRSAPAARRAGAARVPSRGPRASTTNQECIRRAQRRVSSTESKRASNPPPQFSWHVTGKRSVWGYDWV